MKAAIPRAMGVIAILLLLCCLFGVYRLATSTGLLLAGQVAVERAGGEPILINGQQEGNRWLTLPEQIVLTDAPQQLPGAVRTGVTCMGLVRFLPCLAAVILCAILLVNVLRGRLFETTNARLLRAAGITVTAAAILVPLLNGYVIPALIRAASPPPMPACQGARIPCPYCENAYRKAFCRMVHGDSMGAPICWEPQNPCGS